MKRDEAIAYAYLRSLNLGAVTYEPDGNRTPDFLVADRIAVEVRRLNQHSLASGRSEGLETVEAALARFFDKLLPSLGAPTDGTSWWVSWHFQRPLDFKALKREIPQALNAFSGDARDGLHTLQLQPNFEMELQPATQLHAARYVLGAYSDFEAGGFVSAEIIRNANLCIAEKASKIAPFRSRYPEWWLLLVDRIGPKLNAVERDDLPNHIDVAPWDRVILLDPEDPSRALELGRAPSTRAAEPG